MVAAQPSDPVCATTPRGLQICVRFENRSVGPLLGTNFDIVLSDPPSVTLLVGQHTDGTLHQWRIWCVDSVGNPADIASITSPGAYNYVVKLRRRRRRASGKSRSARAT